MNKVKLTNFLDSKGYKEVRNEKSNSFGDYLKQYTSLLIGVRLSSSRSVETLDICSEVDRNDWYDVALVKALIDKEIDLKKEISFDNLTDFFIEEHNQIEKLFRPDNFPNTKNELEMLEKKRVSQMFPNL